jgi:hypothetical protein
MGRKDGQSETRSATTKIQQAETSPPTVTLDAHSNLYSKNNFREIGTLLEHVKTLSGPESPTLPKGECYLLTQSPTLPGGSSADIRVNGIQAQQLLHSLRAVRSTQSTGTLDIRRALDETTASDATFCCFYRMACCNSATVQVLRFIRATNSCIRFRCHFVAL